MDNKLIRKKYGRVIYCPHGERHIDKGRFAIKPHKRHLCIHKKRVWDKNKKKYVTKKIKEFFTVKESSIGI